MEGGGAPSPARLTAERRRLSDGTTATEYEWRGEAVPVRDDAASAVRFIEALSGDAPREARADGAVKAMLPDLGAAVRAAGGDPEALAELVSDAAWDVYGIDLSGERACGERLWDPAEDAALIRVSLRQAYGIDWDEEKGRMSFAEFAALVSACPMDTPMGRAVHYRDRRTRPDPSLNGGRDAAAWDRASRALSLKGPRRAGAQTGDGAMRDAFAALKRSAR